jgi:hypothetical protein
MLLIGIPLLLLVQVPIQQKIGVILVFSMGIFVIIAALLNKIYSTVPALLNDSVNYTFWYMREATVSVYVINLPTLWPVLRKFLPKLTGRGSSASRSQGNTSNIHNPRSWATGRKRTLISSKIVDDFEMKTKGKRDDVESESESVGRIVNNSFNTSQEHIVGNENGNGKYGHGSETSVLEINYDVTYSVEHSQGKVFPLQSNIGMVDKKRAGNYSSNVQTGSSDYKM